MPAVMCYRHIAQVKTSISVMEYIERTCFLVGLTSLTEPPALLNCNVMAIAFFDSHKNIGFSAVAPQFPKAIEIFDPGC